MQDDVELLKQLYAKFNARDIDGVLAHLHPDVVWANGMEGGYVYGHNGIRDYWSRQWTMIDPHVEPVEFSVGENGATEVEVHQVVRDLQGDLLADKTVAHLFQMVDGVITRFDIR